MSSSEEKLQEMRTRLAEIEAKRDNAVHTAWENGWRAERAAALAALALGELIMALRSELLTMLNDVRERP